MTCVSSDEIGHTGAFLSTVSSESLSAKAALSPKTYEIYGWRRWSMRASIFHPTCTLAEGAHHSQWSTTHLAKTTTCPDMIFGGGSCDATIALCPDEDRQRNANLRIRLIAGRSYVLRVRLYYADRPGDVAVMLW